jgi:Exopolysaccharide biosynthesis protein YbjH
LIFGGRRARAERALLLGLCAASLIMLCQRARAETDLPTASLYGGVGLLDTRTARFMPDGYLSFSGAMHDPDDRIAGTFQIFPWAEVTFRYSINYAAKAPNNPQRALYDRSFDLKLRLSHEDDYFPELAIGFQDIIGTGVYAGEYLVASKHFGPIDATIGMGWGRLASCPRFGGGACSASIGFANPFGLISSRFKSRPGDSSTTGGQPLFQSWFHGQDVGIFGGIEYTTPIRHLKLQVEYSSDRYLQEKENGGIDFGYPVNVGLTYRLWEATDVGIAFMHGRTIAAHLTFMLDPGEDHSLQRIDQAPHFRARNRDSVDVLRRYAATNAPAAPGDPTHVEFVDLTAPAGNAPGVAPWHVEFTDLTTPPHARQIDSPPGNDSVPAPSVVPRPAPLAPHPSTSEERAAAVAKILVDLAAQQLEIEGVDLSGSRARVVINNTRYRRDTEAIARAARVLSADAPLDVDVFEIATWREGVPLATVALPRDEIDRLARWQSSPIELWHVSTIEPASPTPPAFVSRGYPRFRWNVYPLTQQEFFDPDNPVFFGFYLGADSSLELARGLSLDASVSGSLYDNFSDIRRKSNSVLPHVRSDVSEYLKDGRYGFRDLMANYRFKLTPETYARVAAGYLEDMFAGVGGEILYRPFGKRWAVGADLWAVQQRDFNRLFGLRDYHTVTGHLVLYYQLPWHDLEMRIHAGRYLAGDWGATFELVRRFESGIEIGGWFTRTNVPAAQFGEGSFDKGIRITIPLEWVVPFGTQSSYNMALRPTQRDGGQMLLGDATLYDMIEPSDYGAMMSQWRSVFRP